MLTTRCPHFLRTVIVGRGRVVWGCGGGASGGGGGTRSWPCGAAQRSCAGAGPLPVPGRSSLWTVSRCWGGGWCCCGAATHAARSVAVCNQGTALIGVRLDVGSLPPRSSSLTVTGCRLGGFPVRRDRWGGERVVGGVLPRINIGADVWGESIIMTGVC